MNLSCTDEEKYSELSAVYMMTLPIAHTNGTELKGPSIPADPSLFLDRPDGRTDGESDEPSGQASPGRRRRSVRRGLAAPRGLIGDGDGDGDGDAIRLLIQGRAGHV